MKLIFKGMLSGGYTAKVYLDWNECGSSVEFPHEEEPYHVIRIGCAFPDWSEVFDGILHEMMEFHMCNMELCYQRWFRAGGDSGDVYFQMSHADYSECISRASQGILCFLDIAKKEFDKHQADMLKPKRQTKRIKKEDDEIDNRGTSK
jgi:hypothetical protein